MAALQSRTAPHSTGASASTRWALVIGRAQSYTARPKDQSCPPPRGARQSCHSMMRRLDALGARARMQCVERGAGARDAVQCASHPRHNWPAAWHKSQWAQPGPVTSSCGHHSARTATAATPQPSNHTYLPPTPHQGQHHAQPRTQQHRCGSQPSWWDDTRPVVRPAHK
jgi:hypothetical protein